MMTTLRYLFKKKLSISPFPLVLLMSCAIGLILLISENAKQLNEHFIEQGNIIDQGNYWRSILIPDRCLNLIQYLSSKRGYLTLFCFAAYVCLRLNCQTSFLYACWKISVNCQALSLSSLSLSQRERERADTVITLPHHHRGDL